MKKLELKHLVGYLPYKAECSYKEYEDEKKRLKAFLTGVSITEGVETIYKRKRNGCSGDYIGFDGNNNINDLEFKLHLRHLSDLTKEIEVNGEKLNVINFIPEYCLEYHSRHGKDRLFDNWANTLCIIEYIKPESLSYSSIQILLEYHFDIFGLIKNNLAIDINTL